MAVRPVFTIVTLVAVSAAAWAQGPNPEPAANRPRELSTHRADRTKVDKDTGERRSKEDSGGGLWPTPKLMKLVLTRWADELSNRYELDDEQQTKAREQMVRRWRPFLDEHRAEVQPLINDMLEMRLGLAPPEEDVIREWARRATPVVEKIQRHLDEGFKEFSEMLTPEQRTRFELDTLAYRAGMQLIDRKLSAWRRGEYEAQDVWSPPGAHRQRRRASTPTHRVTSEPSGDRQGVDAGPYGADAHREKGAAGKRAAVGEFADQIALEVDVWTKYVLRFTQLFELDDGQKTSVESVLDELKSRALSHRDRHRYEITELERRILQFGGGEDDLASLKQQLTELYGPVDEMFRELKRRIETVPTAAQRQAALAKKRDNQDAPGRKPSAPAEIRKPANKTKRGTSESSEDQKPPKR